MRQAMIATLVFASTLPAIAEIPWSPDLKSAHQRAQAEGKLLLVHFESDNCVWCRRLEAGAFQSNDVANAIGRSYVAVKINASKNRKLAEYFKVNAFPTDVVVDATGAVFCHSVSPQAPDKYVAMLEQAIQKSGTTNIAEKPAAPAQPAVSQNITPGPSVAGTPPGPAGSQFALPPSPAAPNPALASNPVVPNPVVPNPVVPDQVAQRAPEAGAGFQMPSHNIAVPPNTTSVSARVGAIDSIQQNTGPANVNQNDLISKGGIPSAEVSAAPEAEPLPPLAMDGYCSVSIFEETKWVRGDNRFGVIHLGKLYLFATEEAQSKFLDSPEKYTPALGGLDVVEFIDNKVQQEGSREYGVAHEGKLYFFSSERTLSQFFHTPNEYMEKANDILRKAMADSRTLR